MEKPEFAEILLYIDTSISLLDNKKELEELIRIFENAKELTADYVIPGENLNDLLIQADVNIKSFESLIERQEGKLKEIKQLLMGE